MRRFARLAFVALLGTLAACDGDMAGGTPSPTTLSSPPAVTSTSGTGAAALGTPGSPRAGTAFAATPVTLPPVVVTRDSTRPAPGCSPREVAEILLAFLDAFNRGDQQQLAHFFGDDFQWYSVTTRGPNGEQRGNYAAFSPTTLLDYFAKQHAQGERLYLRTVDVAGSWGRADIAYVLAHDAGDPVQDASGKGTLSCPDRRIVAWSMSIGAPIRMPCPAPPAGTPPSAVVACARAETPGTETPAATPVPGQP